MPTGTHVVGMFESVIEIQVSVCFESAYSNISLFSFPRLTYQQARQLIAEET